MWSWGHVLLQINMQGVKYKWRSIRECHLHAPSILVYTYTIINIPNLLHIWHGRHEKSHLFAPTPKNNWPLRGFLATHTYTTHWESVSLKTRTIATHTIITTTHITSNGCCCGLPYSCKRKFSWPEVSPQSAQRLHPCLLPRLSLRLLLSRL